VSGFLKTHVVVYIRFLYATILSYFLI